MACHTRSHPRCPNAPPRSQTCKTTRESTPSAEYAQSGRCSSSTDVPSASSRSPPSRMDPCRRCALAHRQGGGADGDRARERWRSRLTPCLPLRYAPPAPLLPRQQEWEAWRRAAERAGQRIPTAYQAHVTRIRSLHARKNFVYDKVCTPLPPQLCCRPLGSAVPDPRRPPSPAPRRTRWTSRWRRRSRGSASSTSPPSRSSCPTSTTSPSSAAIRRHILRRRPDRHSPLAPLALSPPPPTAASFTPWGPIPLPRRARALPRR